MAITLDKEAQKIVKIYSLLYNLVFVCGIPILAFIGSSVIIYFMQADTTDLPQSIRTDDVKIKETQLLKSFDDQQQEGKGITGIDVVIKKGPLLLTGGTILQSTYNYIKYRGLPLPRDTFINIGTPLPGKEYFQSPGYTLAELQRYMQVMVFTTKKTDFAPTQNEKIPLNGVKLIDYFNIGCAASTKLYPLICDAYIQQFIRAFPVYNLAEDYRGLEKIFEDIKDDQQTKKSFCDGLQKYIQYADDRSTDIAILASKCGQAYGDFFSMYTAFITTQEDLASQVGSQIVFSQGLEINAFKLISIQQLIYRELMQSKLNGVRIEFYLKFVEELLKKKAIEPFYKDLIYIFNTKYLQEKISAPDLSTNASDQEQVKKIMSFIRQINKGNPIIGYEGLEDQLFGNELNLSIGKGAVSSAENTFSGESDVPSQEKTLLTLFEERFSFPSLRVYRKNNETVDGKETVKVEGLLTVKKGTEIGRRLDAQIWFYEDAGTFVLKKVSFPESDPLTTVINGILSKNELSMPKAYEYIIQNENLFNTEQETITLCDYVKQDVVSYPLSGCNETEIIVDKPFGTGNVSYIFTHTGGFLTKISVNDEKLGKEILEKFGKTRTDQFSIGPLVEEIITYEIEVPKIDPMAADETREVDRIAISSRFEKYIGVVPAGIMTKGGKTLVAFTLSGIDLVGSYNLDSHTIESLFFKKLGTQYPFENFDLVLEDSNIEDLDFFLADTLGYLDTKNKKHVFLFKNKK